MRAFLFGTILLFFTLYGAAASVTAEVKERVLGDPEAPVEIIEYSSLTCPHCADFHIDTLPALKERYIDTGTAKLVYRDFPLDAAALQASVIAHCAGEERYFRFLDAFFANQSRWARAADPAAALAQTARLGGLSAEALEACLNDQAMFDAVLQMRLEGQQEYDIGSTPTFIIDGETISGNRDIEEFAELVEAAAP